MNKAQHHMLPGFFAKLYELYRQSLCCLLLQTIAEAWKASWCCTTLCRLLLKDPACMTSRCHKGLHRLNEKISCASDAIGNTLQTSFFCRLLRKIFKTVAESRLLGWLFTRGGTGCLLYLIGGYVIWDWLLRDILAVPVISSLWDELLMVISIVYLLYQRAAKQTRLAVSDTPLDMPVFFFLAVSVILLLVQLNKPSINIAGLRAAVQYILWFYIVTRLIRDDEDCLRLYGLMVLIASVVGLHGIYQYIVGAPMPAGWTDAAEASVRTRVYSIFSSCNIMGDYMLLFAPMAAGVAYASKNIWVKLFAWGCTGVMCLSCLLTMSRGAWVALVVAIIVFALLVDLRLLVLMVVAATAALFLPFVQSRLGYLMTDAYAQSASKGGRSIRWEKAIEYLFKRNPYLGMGHGMFGGAIAMQNKPLKGLDYFYTDNYYVKVLAETGFIGLFSYIVMMLGLLWTSLKAWFRNQQKRSRMSPLCAGMLSGMTGVLVHCYFENIFEEPYMMATFWTIAAMTMYLGFLRPEKTEE